MRQKHPHILYPPGGILIWMVVVMELVTFIAALAAFAVFQRQHPVAAAEAARHMNAWNGLIYSVTLITGGFFMARAIQVLKAGRQPQAAGYILVSIFFGVAFLVLKSIEYAHKMEAGHTWTSGTYFMYYWLITGFHYLHVLMAVLILTGLYVYLRRRQSDTMLSDVMMGGIFWHLCDIIWILIFPMFYLI